MSCDENRLLHSALLDGELAPDERVQVEAHLATCAECTAELTALARTLGMLHALPHARAPLGFVDRVLVAARPMPWHQRWGRRLFQPLRVKLPLEAAAVMLVALGAVYVFQNTPGLQQAARQEEPVSPPAPARQEEPVSEPVPVAPSATPVPPSVPAVTGTPAPSPNAPAEAHRQAAEMDRTDKKKEREGALADAPAKAAAPPGPPLEARSETKPPAKPGGGYSREAPPASGNLMKDALRGQTPAAAPPAAAPPEVAAGPPAAPGVAAPPTIAARLFVAPDASGRLSVADRAAADRALADLGARLGVTQAFRRDEPDGATIEWIVPREIYPEFVRGLAGIGRWTADHEAAALPVRVRLQVRVGS